MNLFSNNFTNQEIAAYINFQVKLQTLIEAAAVKIAERDVIVVVVIDIMVFALCGTSNFIDCCCLLRYKQFELEFAEDVTDDIIKVTRTFKSKCDPPFLLQLVSKLSVY